MAAARRSSIKAVGGAHHAALVLRGAETYRSDVDSGVTNQRPKRRLCGTSQIVVLIPDALLATRLWQGNKKDFRIDGDFNILRLVLSSSS